MQWIADSLRTAIAAVNPFNRGYQRGSIEGLFSSQLAIAAYLSSGMLRKVINIPASDRVREWRDWQADKPQIALLEVEEKRLGLVGKVKFAEVLRGIGGGALVLVTAGDHSQPLNPETLGKGGLVAVNVASRWQLRAADFVKDLASPDYGLPAVFKVESAGNGVATSIHPSRVICFRGDPLPVGASVSDEEAFWGDSRLIRVLADVSKSDNAALWFSELVKKAKLLRIGIPNIADMVSTDAGRAKLDARVALIATGENALNATVFDAGDGSDKAGEKITDFTMNWTGIPAMQDMFDQRVAAVSDIPFTRLMGRSPAGMNATGAYDDQNWAKAVSSGQQLETRPCLEQLDPVLIRSAGVPDPSKVTWKWAPLWSPTEGEEATTFKTTMEAVTALQNTGAIPDEAMARGLQNLMSEREWIPGLDQALALIPEDERFGLSPDAGDGEDPSALTEGGDPVLTGAGGDGSVPRRRAANDARFNDATPQSLYVRRDVVNVAELQIWATAQGLGKLQSGPHVTIVYSKQPMDWMKIDGEWNGDDKGQITIPPGGVRIVEPLGDRTAVLLFTSSALSWRHESIVRSGASHDYDDYQPHISLTGDTVDLSKIKPYRGKIVLGPEIFEEVRSEAV